MITRFRKALLWLQAIEHSRCGAWDQAFNEIEKMERLAPLSPLELAFKATIFLVQHRFDEAEELRDHVARITERAQDPKLRYVNLYVRSARASIEGDHALMNCLLREAETLNVSKTFQSWLPIRD